MSKDELKSEKASKKSGNKKDKTPAKKSGKSKGQKKQPNKVAKYFKDLKSEFKKVVWPTKKQLINNSTVVLVTIAVIGIFVGLLDAGLGYLLKFLLSK